MISVKRPKLQPVALAPTLALLEEARGEIRRPNQPSVKPVGTQGRRSKYAPVGEYLQASRSDRVDLSCKQIEDMEGEPLPPSAHNHRAAWSNSDQNTWPLMGQVRAARWKVESVQMGSKVVFVRAR